MAVKPGQQAFESEFALGDLHALDQIGDSGEQDAISVLDQGEADGGGEMALLRRQAAQDGVMSQFEFLASCDTQTACWKCLTH